MQTYLRRGGASRVSLSPGEREYLLWEDASPTSAQAQLIQTNIQFTEIAKYKYLKIVYALNINKTHPNSLMEKVVKNYLYNKRQPVSPSFDSTDFVLDYIDLENIYSIFFQLGII